MKSGLQRSGCCHPPATSSTTAASILQAAVKALTPKLDSFRPQALPSRGWAMRQLSHASKLAIQHPRHHIRVHRGRSSDGRALQSHCRGQGFDSPRLHQIRKFNAPAKKASFRRPFWHSKLPGEITRQRSLARLPDERCAALAWGADTSSACRPARHPTAWRPQWPDQRYISAMSPSPWRRR